MEDNYQAKGKKLMLRAAGKGIAGLAKFLKGDATKTDLAIRLGMDLIPATIAGAATPGDLGDKLITGGSDFLLSGVAGLGAGRLAGKNQALGTVMDMAGSYGGAYASMPVADTIMRGKDAVMGGSGLTPYERLGEAQQLALKEEITQNVLAAYGLMPGTRDRYLQDPSTGMGVS